MQPNGSPISDAGTSITIGTEYSWSSSNASQRTLSTGPVRNALSRSTSVAPSTSPKFRFHRRYCVLTYSQVPSGFVVDDLLRVLERDGCPYVVARERHRDGGIHYHAFLDYLQARDFTNNRRWDAGEVHPNVLPVTRTPGNAYKYVCKAGDIVKDTFSVQQRRRLLDNGRGDKTDVRSRWSQIAAAPNKNVFFEKCQEMDPRALVCSFGNVQRFAEWKYPEHEPSYSSPVGLTIDLGGYRELRDYFATWDRERLGPWRTRYVMSLRPLGPLEKELRGTFERPVIFRNVARRSGLG